MRSGLLKVGLAVIALCLSALTGCAGPASPSATPTARPLVTARPSATRPAPALPSPAGTRPAATASPSPTAPRTPTATRPAVPSPTATSRPKATPGTQTPETAISITNLTPVPNSAVSGDTPVIIAANVSSTLPIGTITVFLDGSRIDVEVGGPTATREAFFTSRMLSQGTHTVRAVVTGQGAGRAEAEWSFKVPSAPAATPARPTY